MSLKSVHVEQKVRISRVVPDSPSRIHCQTILVPTGQIFAWTNAGVFNLSDIAGHINNFNDARGPQSYDVFYVHIIGKSGRSINLTTNRYIMCRQRAGIAFVVFFVKTAGGPRQRAPLATCGPRATR
jgi:hypothetical protein